MRSLAPVLLLAAGATARNYTATYSFPTGALGVRTRDVPVIVCLPDDDAAAALPLVGFAHGFGLYAEDYGWMCEGLATRGYAVGLVDSYTGWVPSESGLEQDTLDVARAMQNESVSSSSSPLAGRLMGRSALAGHSLGGTTTVMAAASLADAPDASFFAAVGLAPSANGVLDDAARLQLPFLLLVGSKDCHGSNGVAKSALPLYDAMAGAARRRALGVLVEGDHCNFTTPTVGSCPYDTCGTLSKAAQQGESLELIDRFLRASLADDVEDAEGAAVSCDSFNAELVSALEAGADAGTYQFRWECANASGMSPAFVNDSCSDCA